MRVLFAGSPEIAVPSLRAVAETAELAGVLTNPESQKGRGLASSWTPVALAAAALPSGPPPLLAFDSLGAEARAAVAELKADLLVSFAYGRIFGPKFLALFPLGGINVHPSLLPRWRGPTPIPAAILHRDAESGVAVQRIALGMDEGDILAVERLPLDPRETTASLSEKAASVGASLLPAVLRDIEAGRAVGSPQVGEVTYSTLLQKEDGLIDWNRPVADVEALVRAYDPWPGAYTFFRGLRLSVLEAEAHPDSAWQPGQGLIPQSLPPLEPGVVLGMDKSLGLMVQGFGGLIALRRLQLQQKKALGWRDFANGVRDLAGTKLG